MPADGTCNIAPLYTSKKIVIIVVLNYISFKVNYVEGFFFTCYGSNLVISVLICYRIMTHKSSASYAALFQYLSTNRAIDLLPGHEY